MRTNFKLLLLLSVFTVFVFTSCDARLLGATISPKKFDFGYVETSQTVTLLIKNNSPEAINITDSFILGNDADKFKIIEGMTPFYLNPKSVKRITIEFTPDSYGQKEASYVVYTSFVGTAVIRCEFKGFGLIASFEPRTHDFGKVDAFQSVTKDFVFLNNLQRSITVSSFSITGVDKSDFAVISGTPGKFHADGGSTQLTVKFTPSSHGPKLGYLTATTTDYVFGTIKTELIGEGNILLVEPFDTKSMCDTSITTAEWGTATPSKLTPTGLNSFGTGADGDFAPTSNTTLNADNGPFNYKTINIPQGVEVKVMGTKYLEILCQGDVKIEGTLNLDGQKGMDAPTGAGGTGGPGGGKGGDYNQNGLGTGGGSCSTTGGGGGYAVNGQNGTLGGNGGNAYGSADLSVVEGGSGGAGGAHAGGGGGGGAVQIVAGGVIELNGLITANGGWGGGHPGSSSSTYNGGGGGSGGAVKLVSAVDVIFKGGTISVQGGSAWSGASQANRHSRGGCGSPGRVRLEDSDGVIEGIGGSIYPTPSSEIVTTPFSGGTGVDGPFLPTSNTTLDTANSPFNYTTIYIPVGITVTAIGSNPLEIYCTGDIIIVGKIDVSGEDAPNVTTYGIGAAGGGNGAPVRGIGSGTGGGGTSTQYYSTGGGGGFGEVGQKGGYYGRASGGVQYGNHTLNPIVGGSGGGGGLTGAGGAGGGAVRLQAAGSIEVEGEIISNGGNAYVGSLGCGAAGGGGSGGAILIQGNVLNITGSLSARGGRGGATTGCSSSGFQYFKGEAVAFQGGWGAFGRIRLEAVQGNVGGIVMSTKNKYPQGGSTALMTGTCTQGSLSINAGIVGQSKFYNSTRFSPTWQAAIIKGTDLGQVKIVFQGADDNGNGSPDPATYTTWFDDLSMLPASQYVRFRILFRPGPLSPSVDQVEMPFN